MAGIINIKYSDDFTLLKEILISYESVYVVYDTNVEKYVNDAFESRYPMFPIIASESLKTIDTVMRICDWLLAQNVGRNSLLVAFGGGITTDITGFAASIYKRGINYVNVPTTLLSQVDAGIGGKTGVNVNNLKNMIGVIKQPEFTFITPIVLKSLDHKQYLSGIAEMLKTFIIGSANYYSDAVDVISRGAEAVNLGRFIKKAAEIKADIVSKDEFETGLRRVLNLGHTYGHAIEWFQHNNFVKNTYSHGESVAVGIIKAAEISNKMGFTSQSMVEMIKEDFSKCGLPISLPCPERALIDAIASDKKANDGLINFVLIEKIGKVFVNLIDIDVLTQPKI